MTTPQFTGVMTALITPFKKGNVDALDEKAFERHIKEQITCGIHGLVPCGTTGEAPTLTKGEMSTLFNIAVETARHRVPVIAGCGSNSTRHAIELTELAQKSGADAALHVTPYYNKPTQEGLYQHFCAIHDAIDIPIIMYNIPGRSVVNMSIETQSRLAKLPRIAGVKDATGDLARVQQTAETCGPRFAQLTGEDALVVPFLQQGGHGVISVTSNILPGLCARLFKAHSRGDTFFVDEANKALMPLHEALFCETSPGPVKFAAEALGICESSMRLPMVPIAKASRERVRAVIRQLKLAQ